MHKFSLKALGATIVALALSIAGVAAPSNAASLTSFTATSATALAAGQTNASPIVLTFVAPTALTAATNAQVNVNITGATGLPGSYAACGSSVSASVSSTPASTYDNSCTSPSTSRIYIDQQTSGVQANATWTITIAAGALTIGAGPNVSFFVSTSDGSFSGPTIRDTGSALLAVSGSSSTVTFNSNGGTGTTASQTASTATALTANAFTRSGYTFSGWNTAADGSGTAYANGASYAFTSSTTLYAQWAATLANTGISSAAGISLLVGGLSLALVGSEMFIISRRKRSN